MNLSQVNVLSGAMPGIGNRALEAASNGMTPSSTSIEAAFGEQHLFSAAAGVDFVSGTVAQAYWRARPVSIPERATFRQLYFALWFDGITQAEAAGQVLFTLRGSAVLALPWRVRRESATLANTYGASVCPFDVWRLGAADVDAVVPSAGALLPDAIVTADSSALFRYMTTISPRRFALTADRVEIQLSNWSIPAGGGSVYAHLAIASQSRPL